MSNDPRRLRRPPAELDRLARRAARLSYQEGWSAADIATELQLPGKVREVAVLLKRSRALVRVHVTEADHEPPPLNERLGRDLRPKLNLSSALVMRPSNATLQDADDDDPRDGATRLHDELGRVAAKQLLGMLRAGDTIGVCAGRGVGYTIEHIHKTAGLAHHPAYGGDGAVLSLAGGVFLQGWMERAGLQHLDNADFNAEKLSDALGRPSKLCCVRAYRPTPDLRNQTIETDAEHLKRGAKDNIDIVLYGASVVDGDHYLQRITDIQADAIEAQRDQLRERAEADARAVVVDHCEHFYIVGETAVDGLRVTVDELNQRMVAIDPDRIAAAPERILVAGGLEKLPALLALIDDDWAGPRPTTLVTDELVARALLERLSSYDVGNDSRRSRGDRPAN